MAALSGDDSEESRQKIQKIKVDLESAREDLQETEHDRYIEDTEKLLDNLYAEYEETLNTRIDDIDALMTDMIAEINANANNISSTLTDVTDAVGAELSDSMEYIWDESNNVITSYGSDFISVQTNTNIALGRIEEKLQEMIGHIDSEADSNVIAAGESSIAKSDEDIIEEMKKNSKAWHTATEEEKKILHDRNVELSKMLSYSTNYNSSTGKWSHYATGTRKVPENEIAWTQEQGQEFIVRPSDGAILTPIAKGDSVLNANASRNIWDMANSPAEFIKDNLNLGVANTPNNSTVQNNNIQNFENIVFSLPNVKNYEELLSALQKDKNFERLINSMTIDQIAGKSSLAKGKAIR